MTADEIGDAIRQLAADAIVMPLEPAPQPAAATPPATVLANLPTNVNADFQVPLKYIIGEGNPAMYTYAIWCPNDIGHRLTAACTAAGGVPPAGTPSGGITEPIPPHG
jgi:hypothetical protein